MAAPATHYTYGGTGLVLESYTITGRLYGLDTVRAVFHSGSATGLIPGQMLPDPLPNLKAREVETTNLGPYYRHSVDAIGFVHAKAGGSMPGFPRWNYNAEDWDSFTDKKITTNRNVFSIGVSGGIGGFFFCSQSDASEIEPGLGWYEVTGSFVGLGSNKPRETTITVNGATYSQDQMVTSGLPGGWSQPQKGTVELPEVVVSQRYLTTLPPPTAAIPGKGTLPALPPVQTIILAGANIVQHWPAGWSYDGIDSKQRLGQPLYDTTIKLRYKHRYTF